MSESWLDGCEVLSVGDFTFTGNWVPNVVMRYIGPSRGIVWDRRGNVMKRVEHYLSDGRLDSSRSHYTRNGRRMKGSKWRRLFVGKA